MSPGELIELNLGDGQRQYVVVRVGRKLVTLLRASDCEKITIAIGHSAIGRPVPCSRTRLAKRLRANARTYGVRHKTLQECLSAIRSAP